MTAKNFSLWLKGMRMQFKTLSLIVLTALFFTHTIQAQSLELTTDESNFDDEILELVNDHRHEMKLAPLEISEGMNHIAKLHSQNMAKGSVEFGHLGFPVRCSKARIVLKGGNLCAENVAMGQKNAQRVFLAWMNSPGHRANIEKARVTHMGFGFAQNRAGKYFWTQLFLEER